MAFGWSYLFWRSFMFFRLIKFTALFLVPIILHSADFNEDLSFEKLNNIVEEHIVNNPGILDVANKDIVALVGYTGAGKSTLLNFLCNHKLSVDEFCEFKLENPDAPGAFKIGTDKHSQTKLPQFVTIDDLHFFDFAGIGDNRGTMQNLVNACLMKRILEHSRSVRFVIVISHSEITSEKAKIPLTLLKQISNFLLENYKEQSLIVVTRSPFNDETKLGQFLEHFLEEEIAPFTMEKKFSQIPLAILKDSIDFDYWRDDIISKVKSISGKKNNYVVVDSLYTSPSNEDLYKIFQEQLKAVLANFTSSLRCCTHMNSIELKNHRQKIEQTFANEFEIKFTESKLVLLLKPIAKNLFDKALEQFKPEIQLQKMKLIQEIDKIIADKIAEEKRAEQIRIAAEQEKQRILQEQEQRRINEEYARRHAQQAAEQEKQRRAREQERAKRLENHQNWQRNFEYRRSEKILAVRQVWFQGSYKPLTDFLITVESRIVYTHPDNTNTKFYGEWNFCSSFGQTRYGSLVLN